jgi:opacity protein-like surface antigen
MIRVVTSRMKRSLLICLLALAASAPAAQARAADPKVWATVNVCDTEQHPNEIGIRAALPARRGRAALRFRVQYHDLAADRWRWVRAADSGWSKVGHARESGWTFEVTDEGTPILRGVVDYRWTRRGKVVGRARRITETGHKSTAGADPPGFSAATCRIS